MKGGEVRGWTKSALGGAALAGSYAGGAVAGGYMRGKLEYEMAQQIERDVWHLGAENRLSNEQPILPLRPRRQWHGVLCYGLGIVSTGFVAWLVTVIITAALVSGWNDPDMHPSEQFTAPLFAGFVVGCLALVPGILVGAFLWLREVRGRIRETVAVPYRAYWAERQHGAQALAQGQADSFQVAQVLASHRPDSVLVEQDADEDIYPYP